MKTPPTAMKGAVTSNVHPMRTSICTCWTSLVERVMRLGAPNRCTSFSLNEPTRRKICARRSRPTAMATLAPK